VKENHCRVDKPYTIYFIQMLIIIIKDLFLVFNMPVSDTVFTRKAYIMREGFKVNSMCGRCDKRHGSFKYFRVNKINETAVTTKKLTNNFAGLVSSGLRPDVASRPPAAPRWLRLLSGSCIGNSG
jgi:hypothetical protein